METKKPYLDDTCIKIFKVMLTPKFRKEGARFNELFRECTHLMRISKPTFAEHLNHLIKKKMLKKQRSGRQRTILSINTDNIIARMGLQAVEEVHEQIKVLANLMKEPDFWQRLPHIIANFFALCELRKVKAALDFYNQPQRNFEYFAAVQFYAALEEDAVLALRLAVQKAFTHPEHKQQFAVAIEKALKELEAKLAS